MLDADTKQFLCSEMLGQLLDRLTAYPNLAMYVCNSTNSLFLEGALFTVTAIRGELLHELLGEILYRLTHAGLPNNVGLSVG